MSRWWWQGEVLPPHGRVFEARNSLYRVSEIGPAYEPAPNPPTGEDSIGVVNVARWIDHLEGLPPR